MKTNTQPDPWYYTHYIFMFNRTKVASRNSLGREKKNCKADSAAVSDIDLTDGNINSGEIDTEPTSGGNNKSNTLCDHPGEWMRPRRRFLVNECV